MEIIGLVVHIQKQLSNDWVRHSFNVDGCQWWFGVEGAYLDNHWIAI